jgi:hypothetical protein
MPAKAGISLSPARKWRFCHPRLVRGSFFIARMLENAKVAVKWKKNCCFHRRKLFCMYKNGAIDAD